MRLSCLECTLFVRILSYHSASLDWVSHCPMQEILANGQYRDSRCMMHKGLSYTGLGLKA
jgi:hypothetical protein